MIQSISFKKTRCLSNSLIRGLIAPSLFLITFFCLIPSTYAATIIVNTGADSTIDGLCSFREAIQAANTNLRVDGCSAGSGADNINFDPNVWSLHITNGPQIEFKSPITISGHTYSSEPTIYVYIENCSNTCFVVRNPASVYIDRLSFVGGAGALGIESGATLSLVRANVSNSKCEVAGCTSAINNQGNLNVVYSSFASNINNRGAIGNNETGVANISYSSFMYNDSQRGGALWNRGKMTVSNCTLGENNAKPYGGAISTEAGTLDLNNVTMAFNTSKGTATSSAGGLHVDGGTVTVANSIIYYNRRYQNMTTSNPLDCTGVRFTSLGYNILGEACKNSATSSDKINLDPGLQANIKEDIYSGFTPTYFLPSSSMAINAGSPATPGSSSTGACKRDDQRGIARSACDIGAVEYAASPTWETDRAAYYASTAFDKVTISNNSSASGGYFTKMHSSGPGEYIDYLLTVPTSGTYKIKVRARKNSSNCRFRLEAWTDDGTNYYALGTKDLYASSSSFTTYDFGNRYFNSKDIVIRFTIDGKNSSSSGYNLELDNIQLSFQ
jgi:hypothetical protein